MDTVVADELEGVITKPYLRKEIKSHILCSRPELANQITGKVVEKCLIYISGYVKCLKYQGVHPINSDEMISLLTQECLDWMTEYVDKGGR